MKKLTLSFLFLLSSTTVCPAQTTYTIFGSSIPKTPIDPDTAAVTLGVKFTSTQAGKISGIRFYRAQSSPSGYSVALYSATGTRLARTSTAQDTCTVPCWEQVSFSAPVSINANTRYVAAYWTPHGGYPDDQYALISNITNVPLTALSNGSSGGDGVYRYGSGIAFPTSSWNASNYFVDIVFTPTISPQQVISSINLSNKTIAANQPAGTIVGQASVVMSPTAPTFSGALATPTTDAYFQMSGAILTTKTPLGAGTYNTSIVATQSGINNSPFTQGESITVTAAPTLTLNVANPNPALPTNAPPGTIVTTIQGQWSNGAAFTGSYPFVAPNFSDGSIYSVILNANGSGNLIVNPSGPGVGSTPTTEHVTLEAQQ
jgi:hypothetical protein